MNVQTLQIGKRKFVVLPKREFDRMAAQARKQNEQDRQDAGDAAESRRRTKETGGVSISQLRARLAR